MACLLATPLARPVDPLVNRIAASSSAARCAISKGASSGWWHRARVVPPQNQRRPAVTRIFAEAKGRRNTVRTACTAGMPMITDGFVRSMQASTGRSPMPGSSSTGTAPILNRPKSTA